MGRRELIERLYLKGLVSFDEVELEFDDSLVVLSGPSGAGKSVLISAILSSFGYGANSYASLCELSLQKPSKLQLDAFELEDEVVIKSIKKEKLRYFLNAQSISKKLLYDSFKPFVKYLSIRDSKEFDSNALIDTLDDYISSQNKEYKKLLKEYKKRYKLYKYRLDELNRIKQDEAKIKDMIEFAKFEIEKIESINPKEEEFDELLEIKQQLSKVDKIKDAMQRASGVFEFEKAIEEVYTLLDRDSSYIDEAFNQLRADFEDSDTLIDSLLEVDIEEVLNRLSQLTELQNRYGSIKEALEYKAQKELELQSYQNITRDKSMLENFVAMEYSELYILANKLTRYRLEYAKELEEELYLYLQILKISRLSFTLTQEQVLNPKGIDKIDISLQGSSIDTLSGGEFNRVRLALMAVATPKRAKKEGVLILDEIDANVSGDESIAIANIISKLSSSYQVFAISHQPHLASKASQHIVVNKKDSKSYAKVLDNNERVEEISRIIAGENPTTQAIEFARKLLDN